MIKIEVCDKANVIDQKMFNEGVGIKKLAPAHRVT